LLILQNKITGIVGPKGSGKTYQAAKEFAREDRALVYQIVRTNDEYDLYATHITDDLVTAAKIMRKEKKFRVVYKVPDGDIIPRGKELVYTSLVLLAEESYLEGNMTLFLDEAHEFCNQWVIDWRLRKIFRLARNQRLNITWVAQSMEVHREIRRNTDEHVFFFIWEPGDLEKIRERCGEATAERVSQLRRLKEEHGHVIPAEYLVWRAYE
jgi:hypothetical protein